MSLCVTPHPSRLWSHLHLFVGDGACRHPVNAGRQKLPTPTSLVPTTPHCEAIYRIGRYIAFVPQIYRVALATYHAFVRRHIQSLHQRFASVPVLTGPRTLCHFVTSPYTVGSHPLGKGGLVRLSFVGAIHESPVTKKAESAWLSAFLRPFLILLGSIRTFQNILFLFSFNNRYYKFCYQRRN